MPYIKEERRDWLDGTFLKELGEEIGNAGELNYAFYRIIMDYFRMHQNYQGINDIIGALEGAKAEFQRRTVGPYEDIKIEENGDIE
jgi:hypothetical protein